MRFFQIAVVFVIIGFIGYAYSKSPDKCMQIIHDSGTLLASLSPIQVEINNGTATIVTNTTTNTPPVAAADDAPPVASPAAAPARPRTPGGALPLPANTLLQNGDFSAGTDHWDGDGVNPSTYAARNPAAASDPLTSKGLIVTLNPNSWTRVCQAFLTGKGTLYSIVVNYLVSPNTTLSQNPADYQNVGKLINVPGFENFSGINFRPGIFFGTVGDPTSASISDEMYVPNLRTSGIQTYTHSYPAVPVSDNKTFVLGFPPGTGTVVILSAAVTSN